MKTHTYLCLLTTGVKRKIPPEALNTEVMHANNSLELLAAATSPNTHRHPHFRLFTPTDVWTHTQTTTHKRTQMLQAVLHSLMWPTLNILTGIVLGPSEYSKMFHSSWWRGAGRDSKRNSHSDFFLFFLLTEKNSSSFSHLWVLRLKIKPFFFLYL